MSNINNTDSVGGRTTHNHNAQIYPTNGERHTSWGTQYDWSVRERIANDIANGVLGLDDMAKMLDLQRSHICDWGRKYRPEFFGPPRKRLSNNVVSYHARNGKEYTKDEKIAIAELITSGRHTVQQVSKQYNVCPSVLRKWTRPGRRFYNNRTPSPIARPVVSKPAPTVVVASKSNTDRLLASPEHVRLVIGILLNDSPAKALSVAKALIS